MSQVSRMFSRKKKSSSTPATSSSSPSQKTSSKPEYFGNVLTWPHDTTKTRSKDDDRKIKGILERLRHHGIDSMGEANVEYALRAPACNGDSEAAYRLLLLLQETYDGLVKPYAPDTRLLGAVNREGVTCYLDALLFAMFSRLDSFEALLYDNFNDMPRKRLAALLRLWVNMLRTGRVITTDITQAMQHALADCGWTDAANLRQQDPSEAFTFITGKLELPLLTLKMDLYHTGKEDPQDDHKFVNERLLEVAILDKPIEGRQVITLEDCLENYFNNTIEVKRHLESQRRNTLKSATADTPAIKTEKSAGMHVEVVELSQPSTPLVESPIANDTTPTTPVHTKDPLGKLRPLAGRKRADSIFSQRKVAVPITDDSKTDPTGETVDAKGRKLSTRTEVLMPAWQFFKLLPWYTDHLPESDAQVAAHFSKKRPVLGICLKRYSYTNTGAAQKLDTYVDIPLEIAVPNFVSDDSMGDDGPLMGNFRLMLQAVVCHRGVSVNSGHYVCLTRGTAWNAEGRSSTGDHSMNEESDDNSDPWMLFDDLARERVRYVDIKEALRQETPYLIFYQVQPIDDDGRSIHDLPSYAEATSRTHSNVDITEKPYVSDGSAIDHVLSQTSSNNPLSPRTEATDFANSARTSLEVGQVLDAPRGRSSLSIGEGRRGSLTSTSGGGSIRTEATVSVPSTPSEEKPSGFLAVAGKFNARRASRRSKSSTTDQPRTGSAGPENNGNRFSLNMSKLTTRISRTTDPASSSDSRPSSPVVEKDGSALPRASTANDSLAVDDSQTSRNPSQESVNTAKPVPSEVTIKKDKEKQRLLGRKKTAKGEEDRECVIM